MAVVHVYMKLRLFYVKDIREAHLLLCDIVISKFTI